MRFLFKISMPVEAGNAAAINNGFKAIQTILQQQKPEAAYFIAEDGKRTAILIMNMEDDEWDEVANDTGGESGIPWVLDAEERKRVRAIVKG